MYNYTFGQFDKYGIGVHEIVNISPAKHGGKADLQTTYLIEDCGYPQKVVCDAGAIRLKTEAETAQDDQSRYAKRRTAEIYAELGALDKKSIRAIRNNETERINEIEANAQALREELATLK